jgi:orotate phosphoribosyltransferase
MSSNNSNQDNFIRFALEAKVLSFGEFKTKAGRLSPYFFNAGGFNDGARLSALGRYYAKALQESKISFDMLYGPAYKGITLVAATAIALADHGLNVPFAYNRKEAKDHGEGGSLVGAPVKGRVVIIDDVISAGTSVRESVDLIRGAGAEPAAALSCVWGGLGASVGGASHPPLDGGRPDPVWIAASATAAVAVGGSARA